MARNAEHKLHELLDGFDTAMLITRAGENGVHARPMGVAEVTESGHVFFATSEPSAKVTEIKNDSDVTLIFQGRLKFVTLEGTATVVKDPGLIERLWSEAWRVWFPNGKDDPALRIIRVEPLQAEYWDSSGAKGVSYAFEAAKAYLKGETPDVSDKQHGKIHL
jgi:general stress protein 26